MTLTKEDRYDYLFKEFGEKKVRERFIFLKEKALRIIDVRGLNNYLSVSDSLISEIVIDYFADVKRLKDFLSRRRKARND